MTDKTDHTDQIDELLARLKQERDELRVKLHLVREDLGDEWDKIESAIARLESRARHVGDGAVEASKDVGAAAKLLVEEIRNGFEKIRKRF